MQHLFTTQVFSVPFTASSTGSPTKAAKSSALMEGYARETNPNARRLVASIREVINAKLAYQG